MSLQSEIMIYLLKLNIFVLQLDEMINDKYLFNFVLKHVWKEWRDEECIALLLSTN